MALSPAQWALRIPGRLARERAAKARHTAAQRALSAARGADAHPRARLVVERDAASKLLIKRRAQVAEAKAGARRRVTHVSPAGAAFIARFEGGAGRDGLFRAYRDPVGVWTIGFGHTEGVHPSSKPLTHRQATDLLLHDLNVVYAPAVLRHVPAGMPLSQSSLDALVSFGYNLGPAIFDPSHDAGKALASRDRVALARSMRLYDKAGSPPRALAGLTRRRRAEARLLLTGQYT